MSKLVYEPDEEKRKKKTYKELCDEIDLLKYEKQKLERKLWETEVLLSVLLRGLYK